MSCHVFLAGDSFPVFCILGLFPFGVWDAELSGLGLFVCGSLAAEKAGLNEGTASLKKMFSCYCVLNSEDSDVILSRGTLHGIR